MMEEYKELSSRLRPCACGCKVKLFALGYPRDTFDIKCEKCGGTWHMNTYSPVEAAEWWGINEEEIPNFCDAKSVLKLSSVNIGDMYIKVKFGNNVVSERGKV